MTARECEHAVEYVYHYLDHQLTWYRRVRIRRHLRKCESCCGAYDFESKLKDLIRKRGRSEPPPELFDRLRALIEEEAAGDADA